MFLINVAPYWAAPYVSVEPRVTDQQRGVGPVGFDPAGSRFPLSAPPAPRQAPRGA